jgi:diguanylate cyclase (GGDEF)-like protein
MIFSIAMTRCRFNQLFSQLPYYRLPMTLIFLGLIVFSGFWWAVNAYLPFENFIWIRGLFYMSFVFFVVFSCFLFFQWRKGKRATEACLQEIQLREVMEQRLEKIANYDNVTGLPNRHCFYELIQQRLQEANLNKDSFFILLLDVPSYIVINYTLGMEFGDQLLIQLARIFKKRLNEKDIIARLEAGTFAIILNSADSEEMALSQAEDLINLPHNTEQLEAYQANLFFNIGIAGSSATNSAMQLMRYAHLALREARKEGPNNIQLFTQSLKSTDEHARELEQALSKAIANQEFHLMYQPIFEVKNNQVIGVEALLRWEHSQLGNIDPQSFIVLAENYGLMFDIGEWVFENASNQLIAWRKIWGELNFYMSINCSALQMLQVSFVEFVKKQLDEKQLRSQDIVLEITETALIPSIERCVAILNQFNQRQIKIAIDDFGTGYASINYLRSLPISLIKIDKSLISEIEQDTRQASIIQAIVELSKVLNIKVLVEGVERKGQLDILREAGCDYVQGFYLAKPMTAADMEKFIQPFLP